MTGVGALYSYLLALCMALLLCGLPSAVFAQLKPETQTGSLIPVQPKAVDPATAGVIRKNFSRCIYRKKKTAVAALLANSDPVSVDTNSAGLGSGSKLSDSLGMSECLGDQIGAMESQMGMSMSSSRLRTWLVEEDYLARNPATPALKTGAVVETERTYVSQGPTLTEAKGLAAFADCVTFRNTAGADLLLRTMPGSKQEIAAARALAPDLGPCLMEDQVIKFTPALIRSIIADGLWNRYARISGPASAMTK